jgi:hypothetical protein
MVMNWQVPNVDVLIAWRSGEGAFAADNLLGDNEEKKSTGRSIRKKK